MSCANPVRSKIRTKHGLIRYVTFGCGKCDYCLKRRQRDWIFRCSYEARKHPCNWVITLTYSDEWLTFTKKGNATLNKRDFQLFMKRLRKRYPDDKIRYFVRGEYGGMFGRPHFHLILFGFTACGIEEVGYRISDLWHYGGVYVDEYSDRAVNYVTDYILKSDDLSVYEDEEIVLPYINVSQRPPIGANFLQSKTAKRAYDTNDYMLLTEDGAKKAIPRYLAKKLDEDSNDSWEAQRRKYARSCVVSSKEITHYSPEYNRERQISRAEALQRQRHKEYINNKAK